MEYMYPTDLMDHSSNMEIGLCWYEIGTNNEWTHDLTDHLMVDLETIIKYASMTYFVDIDVYELHSRNGKKSSDGFTNEC